MSRDDGPASPETVTGLCIDGPMAGTEMPVPLEDDGDPVAVVDVDGHTYVLAVQGRPVAGRPWRYSVVRDGNLYVIDGGGSTP